MDIQSIIDFFFVGKSSERSEGFVKFLSEKMWNMMGGVYFLFFRRPNEKSEMQREEAPSDRRSLFRDLSLSRAGNRERR